LVTKNTKIIIILSIFGGLIVFGTNFLPDLIQDESEKTEYSYETTFKTGRPSDAPNKIIPGKEQCEIAGGLWGIWGNQYPAIAECNPSTSDGGMECSDSSQCQSFCQAKEGAQIGTEDTGMCYGYELAICLQEVRNGTVDPQWCQ